MGESERYLDRNRKVRKISLGDDNNALIALVGINALLFICFGMVRIIYQMSDSTITAFNYEVLRWAILPARLEDLALMPWTLVSYMFVQSGLIATIISLLWLWAFGSILQTLTGNRHLFPIYLYGGLAGGIFFIVSTYAIPVLGEQLPYLTLSGPGASILALAVAATTLSPRYKLFPMLNGGIPLWILTAVYALIVFAGHSGNAPLLVANAGGAVAGFAYVSLLQKGHDTGSWMHRVYDWFFNLMEPGAKKGPNSLKQSIFYNTRGRKPFEKQPMVTQERIDGILDKINQKGYSTLTDEEKDILKKAAEEEF